MRTFQIFLSDSDVAELTQSLQRFHAGRPTESEVKADPAAWIGGYVYALALEALDAEKRKHASNGSGVGECLPGRV